jgi:hypothetical protein
MTTVALMANTLAYPRGGGHRWAYLNWALGFRSIGCDVLWLEWVETPLSSSELTDLVAALETQLDRYGFAHRVAVLGASTDVEGVTGRADVLVNFFYGLPAEVVGRFRRSVLVDVDPGLLQTWMVQGSFAVAPHDVYFTIGETVGTVSALFPDAGRRWTYTPPCVSLDAWPTSPAGKDASFTTVTHWSSDEHVKDGQEWYLNDKRSGFLPFLDLPQHVDQRLEVAVFLARGEERTELEEHGWHVRHSLDVASTPWDYQSFIRASRGEFSCAKPWYVRHRTAWVSDRTLCYLASGRPAVVQDTGASRILPDACGLLRFRDFTGAIRCLHEADENHAYHARAARAFAEEHFDARCVTRAMLERALA